MCALNAKRLFAQRVQITFALFIVYNKKRWSQINVQRIGGYNFERYSLECKYKHIKLAFFATYEYSKYILSRDGDMPLISAVLCGALGGFTCCLASYPLDVVKTLL